MNQQQATTKQKSYADSLIRKSGLTYEQAAKLVGAKFVGKVYQSKSRTSELIDALLAEIDRQADEAFNAEFADL